MDRFDFFFRQKVTEGELDAAFDEAELADQNQMLDLGLVGVLSGAVVTEKSGTPNLTVDVSGSASAHNKNGERISFGPTQNVDVSVDYLSVSTDVGTPGSEKIVSVFAKFDRTLTDPRIDGNSLTVYFNRAESFDFHVTQGSETASPPATPPSLDSEHILLADIQKTFGQTQVLNANITGPTGTYTAITERREDAFVITAGSSVLRSGTPEESDQAIATALSSGVGVAFVATENWADASSIAATDVSAAINEIVADLASNTDGSKRIGSPATSNQLHDGQGLSVGDVYAQIDQLVLKLGQTTGVTNCGADRIGTFSTVGVGPTNPLSVSGSVQEVIQAILNKFNAHDTANTWTTRQTLTGGATFGAGIVSTVSAQSWELANNGSWSVHTSVPSVIFRVQEDLSGVELHNVPLVLGRLSDITWSSTLTGDVSSSRTISIDVRAGTGANKGSQLQAFAQPGQAVAAGGNNDGGAFMYGGGAVGTGGTAGTGNYGTTRARRNAAIVEETHWRENQVTGVIATDFFDSPVGNLGVGEAAFYHVEVMVQADPAGLGSAQVYQADYICSASVDSGSTNHGDADQIVESDGASLFRVAVSMTFGATSVPRIQVTPAVANTKWVRMKIREIRCPAA